MRNFLEDGTISRTKEGDDSARESKIKMMKTRLFDHIDLRVKDMEVAAKFYAKFLPQLGFVREKHEPVQEGITGEDFHTFYSAGGDRPSEFFCIAADKNHWPNGTRIAFLGRDAGKSGRHR
jgi:catechol 2,3-dioxygenase-like lactoylglutathione lyase family enzyme